MQAISITKYLIFISLAVMLVNGLGLFNSSYIPTDESIYAGYTLDAASQYQMPEQPTVVDYFMISATWLWNAFMMLIGLIMVPIKVLPWAMSAFGIPASIQVIIGVGVFFAIIFAIIQWQSGKSTEAYE